MTLFDFLRRWIFRRRLRKFLDLPMDRFPGGDVAGTAWAFYLLARGFEVRTPMPKDTALAFRLYLRSAQAGLPLGQICAGLAYRTGAGTPMDLVVAQAWWQVAADQGDPGGEVLVDTEGDVIGLHSMTWKDERPTDDSVSVNDSKLLPCYGIWAPGPRPATIRSQG